MTETVLVTDPTEKLRAYYAKRVIVAPPPMCFICGKTGPIHAHVRTHGESKPGKTYLSTILNSGV